MGPITLESFKSASRGKSVPLVTPVTDETGAQDYELRLAGPAPLIKRCFADSKFNISIDPKGDRSAVLDKQREDAEKQRSALGRVAQLLDVGSLGHFKPAVPTATAKASIQVSLARVRGKGTLWIFGFPYFLTRGQSVFLPLPPLSSLWASVTPLNGDQDLFLSRLSGATIASSIRAGTAMDAVSYGGEEALLILRIFGFASGAGVFWMIGWG